MKFSIFTGEKNPCILHGQVFVMDNENVDMCMFKTHFGLISEKKKRLKCEPLHCEYELKTEFEYALWLAQTSV